MKHGKGKMVASGSTMIGLWYNDRLNGLVNLNGEEVVYKDDILFKTGGLKSANTSTKV